MALCVYVRACVCVRRRHRLVRVRCMERQWMQRPMVRRLCTSAAMGCAAIEITALLCVLGRFHKNNSHGWPWTLCRRAIGATAPDGDVSTGGAGWEGLAERQREARGCGSIGSVGSTAPRRAQVVMYLPPWRAPLVRPGCKMRPLFFIVFVPRLRQCERWAVHTHTHTHT